MEEHAVARQLQQSREQIRELLMPGSSTGHALPGQFPRSAVMRFVLDSRKRSVAIAAAGAVLGLMRRRKAASGGTRWPQLANLLVPLLGAVRRR
jgi:hypothetical protein